MSRKKVVYVFIVLVLIIPLTSCDALEDVIEYVLGDGDSGNNNHNTDYPSGNSGNNESSSSSNKTAVIVGYDANMAITEFTCFDAEEDDYVTSSGQDEIVFIYTLLEINENGYAVRAATHAWGPYDIYAGNSFGSNYFPQVELSNIPVGHGLISLFNVTDIEDYSKAKSYMDKINKYMGYVKLANTFNPEPESKAAIEIIGEVLYYSGKTLDIVDWLDDDDTLFDHKDVGSYNQIYPTLQGGGNLFNGWNFSGTNNTDDYSYNMAYTVYLDTRIEYR